MSVMHSDMHYVLEMHYSTSQPYVTNNEMSTTVVT